MKRYGFVSFSMLAIALICSGSAVAQGDNSVYFVTYFANNVAAAPDASVRVINDGSAGAYGAGDLYADFYLFDDSEELITCCSCQVTPDGLLSESVKKMTASAIREVAPTRGVIKMISSTNGFFPVAGEEEPPAEITSPGLRVWATHIQSVKNETPDGPAPYSQTETILADSNLVASDQSLMEILCWVDALLGGSPCPCTPEDSDF
jgi:hypothetical protein